ncbi:UPF0158 family protein [Chloroflexota bacterium]
MKQITINRMDFELVFGLSDYETTAYLDTQTGTVAWVQRGIPDQLYDLPVEDESLEAVLSAIQAKPDLLDWQRTEWMDAARVEWDEVERYVEMPRQDSREGYRDMEAFIWSLDDEHLRELLEVAIQGAGAFRRFKDVLYRYPDVEKVWFAFRDEREQQRMVDWLASIDIEPQFE